MALVLKDASASWAARNTSQQSNDKGKGTMRCRFDSLPDLQRWLEANPRLWGYASSEAGGRGNDWDFGAGWAGSLQLAKTGWSEGAALVRDIATQLMAKPVSGRAPQWGYDVAGDIPDVGRFMAGRPDNMRRRRQTHGRAPIVTVCVNQSVSGGTSATAFRNYGAALLATIDQIEHSGQRVELWTGFAAILIGERPNHFCSALTRVKAADEPVDLGALAFGTAHPAFFRRLGFAILERTPKAWQSSGYGKCGAWSGPADLIDGPDNALFIDGLGHGNDAACREPEGALKLAVRQINEGARKMGIVEQNESLVEMERA